MSTDLKDLGERVNSARLLKNLKPLANPAKQGKAKLEAELKRLLEDGFSKPVPTENEVAAAVVAHAIKEEEAKASEPAAPVELVPAKKAEAEAYTIAETLSDDQVRELLMPERVETIRSMSERLLAYVLFVDEGDKRTVGLLYKTIVALVKMKFKKADTSIECLRWYAVHMRANDQRLPQKRPRPITKL